MEVFDIDWRQKHVTHLRSSLFLQYFIQELLCCRPTDLQVQ